MLANDNQLGRGLAIEGKGDLIEATLGFVVDADWALAVAIEGNAAEIAYLRRGRGWWSRDRDRRVGGGLFAEVVDDAPVVLSVAVGVLLAIWPEEAE